jgi:hypothetical protein
MSRSNELDGYSKREVVKSDSYSGFSFEKALNIEERTWYNLVIIDNELVRKEQRYKFPPILEDVFDGMVQGFKIAMHKNEAKELLKEMGMGDEPKS